MYLSVWFDICHVTCSCQFDLLIFTRAPIVHGHDTYIIICTTTTTYTEDVLQPNHKKYLGMSHGSESDLHSVDYSNQIR